MTEFISRCLTTAQRRSSAHILLTRLSFNSGYDLCFQL